MHRDIKLENFVYFKNKNNETEIKLIDFGLSEILEKNSVLNKFAGSPVYVAPEVIEGT